jgi:hypothetical protein
MNHSPTRTRDANAEIGKKILNLLITEERRKGLSQYLKNRLRARKLRKEFRESKSHLTNLYQVCLQHLSPVVSPMVLISQIHRAGGSMLSQLFDGHPEVHAHPHELKIGNPKKYIWPQIDLNAGPEQWFETLFEDVNIRLLRKGYKKMPKHEKDKETFLFIFLPVLQREIFLKYINSIESLAPRDVFDAYMTSYFGAWLNNQNFIGQKKFVTAFTPRLTMRKDNVESFFEIYPDGRLISIIRDPRNWYPSAYRHNMAIKRKKYKNIQEAIGQWLDDAQSMSWNKQTYAERVCIIRFEDLVSKTEHVMRYLAEFLDISYDNILLLPTFNKYPIKANTSFDLKNHGIIQSPLRRYKTLTEEELGIIDTMAREPYEKVLSEAVVF